jgi:hypothetical protein
LGLFTIALGYFGSSILGFGGDVGGGGYMSYYNGKLSYGPYVVGGVGAGLNVSAGVQLGFYTGDTDTFGGRTNNIDMGVELAGVVATYSTSGQLVGGAISIGPSLTPIYYSAVASVTGLLGGKNHSAANAASKLTGCN